MAIRIDVTVRGTEAILRLDTLPKRLRKALLDKMYGAMAMARDDLLSGRPPGKYLDPQYVDAIVEQRGDVLVGTLRVADKPGIYSIFPSKASVLRFIAKSGDIVFTQKVLRHPFPKGEVAIERYFLEKKPWLIEQIEDTVFDTVYS